MSENHDHPDDTRRLLMEPLPVPTSWVIRELVNQKGEPFVRLDIATSAAQVSTFWTPDEAQKFGNLMIHHASIIRDITSGGRMVQPQPGPLDSAVTDESGAGAE